MMQTATVCVVCKGLGAVGKKVSRCCSLSALDPCGIGVEQLCEQVECCVRRSCPAVKPLCMLLCVLLACLSWSVLLVLVLLLTRWLLACCHCACAAGISSASTTPSSAATPIWRRSAVSRGCLARRPRTELGRPSGADTHCCHTSTLCSGKHACVLMIELRWV